MRPKITTRVPQWAGAGFVRTSEDGKKGQGMQLPDFRRCFGRDIGHEAAGLLTIAYLSQRAARAGAQDVRRTLEAIERNPDAIDRDRNAIECTPGALVLADLDPLSDCLLTDAAWTHYSTLDYGALGAPALAACARHALDALQSRDGRPSTDDLALAIVRALLASMPEGTAPADRDALLSDALCECGIGAGQKNIERLRAALADMERGDFGPVF